MAVSEIVVPFVSPPEVLAAATMIPAIGIMTVGLRFWQRSFQKAKVGPDDLLIVPALLCVIGMGSSLIYGVEKKAIAYPTPQLPGQDAEKQLTEIVPAQTLVELIDWITWILMVPANGLIKLSAIFLYRRIFVVNKRTKFDIITKLSLYVMGIWTIAFLFAQIFGCGTNFDYPWKPLLYIGECNTNTRLDALMITDLITDVYTWFLPIPMIWSLHMKTTRKIIITGIFMLAAVSLAAAIIRLIVQSQISNGGYAAHTDVDLTLTTLIYWSMIESGLAVIAACLPTLSHLVTQPFSRSASSIIRKTLSLRSLLSHSKSNSWPSNDAEFSKIETGSVKDKPSYREHFEGTDNDVDMYRLSDIARPPSMPIPSQKNVANGR